MRKNDL